jgi:hypothetical protein
VQRRDTGVVLVVVVVLLLLLLLLRLASSAAALLLRLLRRLPGRAGGTGGGGGEVDQLDGSALVPPERVGHGLGARRRRLLREQQQPQQQQSMQPAGPHASRCDCVFTYFFEGKRVFAETFVLSPNVSLLFFFLAKIVAESSAPGGRTTRNACRQPMASDSTQSISHVAQMWPARSAPGLAGHLISVFSSLSPRSSSEIPSFYDHKSTAFRCPPSPLPPPPPSMTTRSTTPTTTPRRA